MDTAIEFEIFDTTFIIQAVLPAEGIKSGSELWLYPQNWETEEVYIPNVTVNNRHSVYRDKISFTPQQYIVYLLDATLPKTQITEIHLLIHKMIRSQGTRTSELLSW